ncbi:MAG: hypothetical protein PSX36_07465 [bacterium]|nr:hypothetical protein [bacterium]
MKSIQHIGFLVCLVLLFVIVFQFVFFISYITVQKNEFSKKVLAERTELGLEVRMGRSEVFANTPGLEWKEEGNELVIQGVFYEVISIHYSGQVAIVRVIADTAENNLFATYFELHKKTDKGLHCFLSLIMGLQFENSGMVATYFNETSTIMWNPEAGKATLYGHPNTEIKPPLSILS